MKARITAKFIPLLAEFMAKQDVRYYLNGAHIQPHPNGGTVLSATDGHRAVMIYDEQGITDGEYIFNITKELKSFASKPHAGCIDVFQNALWVVNNRYSVAPGKRGGIQLFEAREVGDFRMSECEVITLGQMTKRVAHVEPLELIEGKFPNLEKQFKEFEVVETKKISFNSKYFAALKNYGQFVQFTSGDIGRSIFRLAGHEFADSVAILIMPMRDDGFSVENAVPSFIADLPGRHEKAEKPDQSGVTVNEQH